MAKLHHSHSTALNGLEAVEMYTKAPTDFRCILTGEHFGSEMLKECVLMI